MPDRGHLLATSFNEKIQTIRAVDNDPESIAFAAASYPHPKITFIWEDALHFHNTKCFNTIVSLETIEHLENPAGFVKHMSALLVSRGCFIASVPITSSMDANPFHLHDFTEQTFRQLFQDAGFRLLHRLVQKQPFSPLVVAVKRKQRASLRKNLLRYYIRHPHKLFLRMRSLINDGFCNNYLVCVFEKE